MDNVESNETCSNFDLKGRFEKKRKRKKRSNSILVRTFVDKISKNQSLVLVFENSIPFLFFQLGGGGQGQGEFGRNKMKSVLEKHDKENQRPMDTRHGDKEKAQDAKDEE